ncbi:4-hydroxybenzoate octaprenyltransferase [Anaplasma bovis]|uniref:4-hydroxybenzoate octaprenyltransferase n=1 Tax=Anaplasma bovis TaxID=186733 RepID=UPI002FF406AB
MRRLFVSYWDLLRGLIRSDITLLSIFPSCASVVLAANNSLSKILSASLLVTIGAVFMHTIGCVINDILDRDIDSKVQRTKNRPLADGRLTVKNATILIMLMLPVPCALLLFTNPLTCYLSVICAIGAALYPLMKRITTCPQIFLGIVWNFGVLIGCAIVANKLTLGCILMYIGCAFWTVAFDTIYAHQDKECDAILGVGSSALKFGDKSRAYILGMNIITIIMWTSCGIVSRLNWPFYMCMLGAIGVFYYQYRCTDFDSPEKCMHMFLMNILAGWWLFFGVCLGSL